MRKRAGAIGLPHPSQVPYVRSAIRRRAASISSISCLLCSSSWASTCPHRLYPRDFQLEKTVGLIGARWIIQAIKNNQDPGAIAHNWQVTLDEFRSRRAKYLLY